MKKKKGRRNHLVMYAVAAGAVLALVVLLRSRGQAAPAGVAGAVDPNAIDPSTGLPYSAAYGTPSAGGATFADNGAAAASSLDTVSSSLSQLDSDVQGIGNFLASAPWQQTGSTSGDTTTTSTPTPDPLAQAQGILALAKELAPAVTKPSPTPGTKAAAKPALKGAGAVYAPSGHNAPKAPKGYVAVGLGHGAWEFRPITKKK